MILVVCGRWRTFGCVEVGKATVCGQGLSSHAVAGRWERSLWSTSRPVLSGRRSECQCHSPESGKKRKGRGQVHHHAPYRDQHTGPEFQQPFSQGPDLSPRTVGACGSQTQLLHQHISGGGQQHAELVGPEIAATGAVDLQLVQFFYPVLDLTTLAVNLFVDPLRTLLHVGDDEARVVFG